MWSVVYSVYYRGVLRPLLRSPLPMNPVEGFENKESLDTEPTDLGTTLPQAPTPFVGSMGLPVREPDRK